MERHDRKTSHLRFGRISIPAAIYFITICTKDRAPILTQIDTGNRLTGILKTMHTSGDFGLIAATIMPDHAHLLLELGSRLRIGQVMGKFKTLSRSLGRARWRWQDDGFEHQVRIHEAAEDYGFYIFMNPYRAGLCPLSNRWQWWVCPNPGNLDFLSRLEPNHSVPSGWLGLSEEITTKITIRG